MWRRAFVATTVALGGTVDDAMFALGSGDDAPTTMRTPASSQRESLTELVAGLTAKTRPERAVALATAIREVVVAADEVTLS